ncbi:MAG TPA: glucoamylase family protein, partial [Thermoanaerobaculia bacterium]|nr:glucoamylase family protein [Thermoanaerobaculia bacterium]
MVGIAWTFVEHTDSRVDLDTLRKFVASYQTVAPLTIGELWALAISLRLVLVENLRRLAEMIVGRRAEREAADTLADSIVAGAGGEAERRERFRRATQGPLPTAFLVQLIARLRDRDPETTPALQWVEERLAQEKTTRDELVLMEHRAQVATHLSVRNVITSMRLMSSVDWTEFFESVSLVEEALRDGTRVAEMDFPTRDRYRHAVESLARGSGRDELDIARRAVAKAASSGGEPGGLRADPGYYLISAGRAEFEKELGYKAPVSQWLRRAWVHWANPGYPATICFLTLAVLAVPLAWSAHAGAGVAALVLLGVLGLVSASEIALAVINQDVLEIVGPRRLPKLALEEGIPKELATFVVVPTLLAREEEVHEQIEQLEVRFLANPEEFVHFALLSDWQDAPAETMEGDEALVASARAAISELNRRHGPAGDGGPRFLLFHRRRVWNAAEGCWMGWERKRGKLTEFNRLLRGASDTTFLPGEAAPPARIRYVITLDADTRLPRGAIRKLVGAMAHALNRPVFDEKSNCVVSGNGILQPRITATLSPIGKGTLYERVFSGQRGTDPYAFAVSDVYQDLFGEGIYTGKGIYDVDAFERALAGRVPDNTLLSHDLFEGIFTRAGLVSDIELFEEFPSHYEVAAARQHRWARGDWQLIPWLKPRVRDASGRRTPNPIPLLGRWKILDNLRRSLLAPASAAALIAAWTLPAENPLVWTLFVVSGFAFPRLLPILATAMPRRRRIAKRSVLRGIGNDLARAHSHTVATLVLLAHQAWLMADAIGRTLLRVLFTRRRLLEWTTAAQARAQYDLSVAGFMRRTAPALVVAGAGLALSILFRRPEAAPEAVFFFVVWCFSPLVAWAMSLPPADMERETPSAADEALLRSTARRTWRFFETFAGEEDHHLPPDNFQEDPRPVVAHRTSPTNIGLSLLSSVAAHDFGWIGASEMTDRLEAAFSTLERLERFRGHLYNWYDTRTLAPLEPRYISTVDSGNLAAHLIVLKQACLERAETETSPEVAFLGIGDALRLAEEAARTLPSASERTVPSRRELDAALSELRSELRPLDAGESLGSRLVVLARSAAVLVDVARAVAAEQGEDAARDLVAWSDSVRAAVSSHLRDSAGETPPERIRAQLARRLQGVAAAAEKLVTEMEFEFLFDAVRKLFSIGYRLSDGRLDSGYYDLLASEARLTSFLAIARGEVPASHWFHLGRPLTPVGKGSALISWSGSMFEYLMPELVMEVPTNSLLEMTTRLVVGRQIRYGAEHGVPWGISESAYNARDVNLTYQYSNFGIGGLGLKRGLSEDLVIAPYATALAAMIDPAAAAKNLRVLARVSGRGEYGYFEAIDYTRTRLPETEDRAVVKAYMAHHQGMTIVSLANVITGWKMRRRFHAEPMVQATELLLQERTPRDVGVSRPRAQEVGSPRHVHDFVLPVLRRFQSPHDATPRAHLLSNGRYTVMTTAAGSGYSRLERTAITRWREDPTRDCWGSYVFLRDVQTGKVWSAAHQPSGTEADSYDVAYYEDRVEIRRRDGSLSTMLEVVVSAEDDAELRQVSVTNLGIRPREIELTSYSEIVLNEQKTDDGHPAFSNLFVETEFVPGLEALVATRRPRSADETRIWAAHLAVAEGPSSGTLQFETDRARFIGRGRDVRTAVVMQEGLPLSGTVGAVLDPIFSLRRRVRLAPGETARITFTTLAARSREQLLAAADRYRDPSIFERTVTLAWTQAQVELRHLQISADEAHLFQRLATRILYSDQTLRAAPEVLKRNARGVTALWAYGISGDLPIVYVRIDEDEDRELVRKLLRAQEYWRLKGLAVDLVVSNEEAPSYNPELQPGLETMIRTSGVDHEDRSRGRVFVLRPDQVPAETRDAIASAARVVLQARNGSLADQVLRFLKKGPTPAPPSARPPVPGREVAPPRLSLQFWNGIGGFSEDGSEYVTILGRGQTTPAPWSNVIANPSFGFLVTESGSGCTWSENSRENQLTPWSNDAVSDPPGEALYVRDEETGEVWTPTALPVREESPYVARHGQGYSRFEHESHEVALELLVYADPDDPVKVSRLTFTNRSARRRSLSLTAYVEWVLGVTRSDSPRFVVTSLDADTGAILARNPWNPDHPERVAFAALDGPAASLTADRTEFLGRNGSIGLPSGLAAGVALSGRVGAGLDPCAAMRVPVSLPPGGTAVVGVFLGQGKDEADARRLVAAHRAKDSAETLREIRRRWDDLTGAVQVKTPDTTLDLLVNRWLLYQTVSCRIWGRTAFYQSSGAFGFRDQLQDSMALAVPRRDILRSQILLCASRQFVQGDVQHWWHPPTGRGVRTRISDDLLWLPFAVARYVEVTGDAKILDEAVPFLEGEPLKENERERYFAPPVSSQSASVYEHCARAIDRSLAAGAHGLPLMGGGDWNDGMNEVGAGGKGESVWLAWFLHANLDRFIPFAEARADASRVASWRERLATLMQAVDGEGWDGDWYRRAFYDDGTPLGSAANEECRIDAIAQSWAVLSGGADPERARRAMNALDQHLVRRQDALALLFTPPFDRTPHNPGYIKGYLPGVRENGGQYTHGAIWSVIAFAGLGEGDRAGELFSILNPIRHAESRAGRYRYRVEPYTMAADVYAEPPHVGRGGWTWYTGSAAWMYRSAVEAMLGLRLSGTELSVDPCIPHAW